MLITGHTGFKGGWLSIWLKMLGADVHGYSLGPPTNPNLYDQTNISALLQSETIADVRDKERLSKTIQNVKPQIVFHMAAQPLVRASYENPHETFGTNIMGTVNLLEACRNFSSIRAIVIVTTDKVYENREWAYPYRETDVLGGHDPYSTSKAAAELIAKCYQKSYCHSSANAGTTIVTARAGNVIGGGDWAKDRLIPDCLRAFDTGMPVTLRYPNAIRPWQHVLEPLCGYLLLAEKVYQGTVREHAWNFGPGVSDNLPVEKMARTLASLWGETATVQVDNKENLHEATLLQLDTSLARTYLQWQSRWSAHLALETTVCWHLAWRKGKDLLILSRNQISDYLSYGPES